MKIVTKSYLQLTSSGLIEKESYFRPSDYGLELVGNAMREGQWRPIYKHLASGRTFQSTGYLSEPMPEVFPKEVVKEYEERFQDEQQPYTVKVDYTTKRFDCRY